MEELLQIHKDTWKNIHPRLCEVSESMVFKYPYYSDIMLQVNFICSEKVPTAGVNFSTNGMNFYYNKNFIDELPNSKCVAFLSLHEIFHLLFSHPQRTAAGGYDPTLANIAQDMIINSIIYKDLMANGKDTSYVDVIYEMVNGKRRNTALFIPKEYTGNWIFEELYEFLNQKNKDRQKQKIKNNSNSESSSGGGSSESKSNEQSDESSSGGGSSESKSNEQSDESSSGGNKNKENGKSNGDDNYGKNGVNGEDCYSLDSILDNMNEDKKSIAKTIDEHLPDDIPQELKDQMVKDVLERINARGRGAGNFEEVVGQLRKSKKDYLREIKKGISEIKGHNKNRTWMKLNRKNLPVKGYKRVSAIINVILDTSGSMGNMTGKILSYVFQNDIQINMIQCDDAVHDIGLIKSKNQLPKMKTIGGGGTALQPAIDLVKKSYNKFNTVILTDGYTDEFDFRGIKGKTLIISIGKESPIEKTNGKVKQIVVPSE